METGWLLETGSTSAPSYLTLTQRGHRAWTPDHMKALRMARREDAEMMFRTLPEDMNYMVRISQHSWMP